MPTSRNLLVTIALICFGLIGAALYLQVSKDLLPCPLCVMQRYLFLSVALGCLLGAFSGKPKLGAGLALLGGVGGLAVAGKHLWLLAHPGMSCGIDPLETALNKVWTAELLPFVFRADGLCEDARETILGLSIPQWSALWFVLITATLVTLLVRRRR